MREAVIVTGVRTPVGKAPKGTLKDVRPDEMAALVIKEAIARTPGLEPKEVDDVILGCAFPEGEQGMNVARVAIMRAGLPNSVPGMTLNRFCSSGLQSIAMAAERIMVGSAEVIIAGGVESMSRVPMGGYKPAPNPYLMSNYPESYMGMGHTAEEVARRYGISRQDQDAFALASHTKAAAAIQSGRFKGEIVPVPVKKAALVNGKVKESEVLFDTDEGVRYDSTLEALAKLKPAFQLGGTVTAGNSSQTSDGAAAVMIMSAERAERLGLKPIAIYRAFAAAGVDPDVMGIGPVAAIPKALALAGITIADLDLVELNEAFAAQSLAVVRELEIDPAIVNVNGGAIALGHPLGCTGGKLTATIMAEAQRRLAAGKKARYGVVSMCVGGGMGAAGVFEFV
ncbi:MAG: acetyl-CoA C-acyltransferase [Symbiobacteriia bacterium]